jgi:Mobilization protein NikA
MSDGLATARLDDRPREQQRDGVSWYKNPDLSRTAVARPKKTYDDRASSAFRVRLTAAERARLDAKAAEAGCTLSRLIRAAVLGYRLPSPPIVREAMNELHRVGGNLNQIARHANATGELADDLDEALAEVMRAVERLLDNSGV